jgi:hypothetical protein
MRIEYLTSLSSFFYKKKRKKVGWPESPTARTGPGSGHTFPSPFFIRAFEPGPMWPEARMGRAARFDTSTIKAQKSNEEY